MNFGQTMVMSTRYKPPVLQPVVIIYLYLSVISTNTYNRGSLDARYRAPNIPAENSVLALSVIPIYHGHIFSSKKLAWIE